MGLKDFDFARRDLETNREEDAVAWAESNGWLVRKMQYAGRRGCPDRFFFGYGQIVMIEFKKPKTDLDGNQVKEHERLRKAGLEPHVCRTKEEVIAILRRYMG